VANEIKVTTQIKCDNANFSMPLFGKQNQGVTQTTPGGMVPGQVSIGTTDTTISFAGLTALGWCYLQNLDATNYVDFGPDSSGMIAAVRLKPGEPGMLIRLVPGTTYKAKANSAACKVLILALDN
jgi:hypothetical protein